MKNLTIYKKLVVGFCIVFMMAVTVGVYGIIGMSSINDADDKLFKFNLLAVDATGSILENYANQRSVNRDFVLYDSGSELFITAENNIKRLESEMETYIAAYTATIEQEDDAAQFKKFTDLYYSSFKNLKDNLHQLGLHNEREQARLLLSTTGTQIANEIDVILKQCYQYNIELAEKTVFGNTDIFHRMMIVEIVLLVITMFVSFYFESKISNLTAKPAIFMKDILRRIGTEGDLTFSDDEYKLAEQLADAKDEIGQSVDMMLTMVRRLVKVGDVLETVSQGDLTEELDLLSDNDTMGHSLKKMTDGLNEMFSEVHNSTEQVAFGAKQLVYCIIKI